MGRKAKWSGPSVAIRVPEHLADQLLELARKLDGSAQKNNVQKIIRCQPTMITYNNEAYMISPPPVVCGDDAESIDEAVDQILEQLSEEELLQFIGEMAKAIGIPVEASHG